MSTKITISYDEEDLSWHLYEECFDFERKDVYLSIAPEEWSFDGAEVTIKISRKIMDKMIKDYLSHDFIENNE